MHSKALKENTIHSISAFDLDYTLFSENSSYRFGKYLCSKKLLPFKSLAFIVGCNIRHRLGLLSIMRLHEDAFKRLFYGRSSSQVKQWATEFVEQYFETLLYLPAIQKLKKAQAEGHLTVILSSTPDFLVEPIAKKLHVPVWNATEYAVDKDQKFCHIARLMLGSDKAEILARLKQQHSIPRQRIYAYSDSHLDLPFLMAAGTAIGVNPNRTLRSICRQNKWPVI
jgi:HAD superfamily hydrolase (TIGR01490 family)